MWLDLKYVYKNGEQYLKHTPQFISHGTDQVIRRKYLTVAARSWTQVTCRSQPIRDEYYCVSTNLRSVLLGVNQSEMSIVLYQPIREQYCFVSTNQKLVSTCRSSVRGQGATVSIETRPVEQVVTHQPHTVL